MSGSRTSTTRTAAQRLAWARGEWSVFLNCENDILRAIRYVNNNPADGMNPQHWKFVSTLDHSV